MELLSKEHACRKCPGLSGYVPGKGPVPCDILLVGEGPGKDEVKEQTPFVGKSGKLLRFNLKEAGFDPQDIYITNSIKCRPPDNRTPTAAEVKSCFPNLKKELRKVKPRLIIAVGNVALKVLTGSYGITKFNGKLLKTKKSPGIDIDEGLHVMPLIHPAAIWHNQRLVGEFKVGIRSIRKCLNGTLVGSGDTSKYISMGDIGTVKNVFGEKILRAPAVAIDIETNDKSWMDKSTFIKSIGFCWAPGEAAAMHIKDWDGTDIWNKQDYDEVMELLRKLLVSRKIEKVMHNSKFDMNYIALKLGIDMHTPLFDTKVAQFLCNELTSNVLKDMAWRHSDMGDYTGDVEPQHKRGVTLLTYNMMDCDVTYRAYESLKSELVAEGVDKVFYDLLTPINFPLARMERRGIRVNIKKLQDLHISVATIRKRLINDMRGGAAVRVWESKHPGVTFNPSSTLHLREVVYDIMKMPVNKRTPKQFPSVDKEAIDYFKGRDPLIDLVADYKDIQKIESTYVKGLINKIHDGRIHSQYMTWVARSGRTASRAPNIQNLPHVKRGSVAEKYGINIRDMFIPDPDCTFIECFPYDAKIELADGSRMKIGKIVENKLPVTVRCKENGRLIEGKVVAWNKGEKCNEWMYIATEQGMSNQVDLILTKDHRVYTNRMGITLVKAGDLKIGDSLECTESRLLGDRKEALLGTLAGDASIIKGKRVKNPRFAFTHGLKQLEYFRYKRGLFKSWQNNGSEDIIQNTTYKNDYHSKRYQSRCSPQFNEIWDIVTVNGKKTLTLKWAKAMTWRSLAFWYMDDGSLGYTRVNKLPTASIASNWCRGYQDLLKFMFSRFSIHPTVSPGYRRISILSNEAVAFFRGIAPYIPECMNHKLPKDVWCIKKAKYAPVPDTSFVKITNINTKDRANYRNTSRYNITVESAHNYICNNLLVKNCDYNQHELRVMAIVSKDQVMHHIFQQGLDIHEETAKTVFNTSSPTAEQRRTAKVLNFGILYGMGPFLLARTLGCDIGEAKMYIMNFYRKFWGVRKWKYQAETFVRKHGYVRTLTGRKRRFPTMDGKLSDQDLRESINTIIQGCLPGDSKVLTRDGYLPISSVTSREIWNGNKWCMARSLNRGNCSLVNIDLSDGSNFVCDTRHEILTVAEDGYKFKKFNDLIVGDRVCQSFPRQVEFGKPLKEIDPYWLGYYYGDGHFYKRKNTCDSFRYTLEFYFGNKNKAEKCVEYFNAIKSRFQYSTNPGHRWHPRLRKWESGKTAVSLNSNLFGNMLEKVITPNETAHTKRLSPAIYTLDLNSRISFIQGILESDGHMKKTNTEIHLCQKDLLLDIQKILRTIGIPSVIRGPYHSKNFISYRLSASSVLVQRIIYNKNTSKRRVIQTCRHHLPVFLKEKLKTVKDMSFATIRSYLKRDKSCSLFWLLYWFPEDPVYWWEEITNITHLGRNADTYTLEVYDPSHRFESEGCIHKNTASDILLYSIIGIDRMFQYHRLKSRLCAQVHDSILISVHKGEREKVRDICKKVMLKPPVDFELTVPLAIDFSKGPTWGSLKKEKK